MCTELKLYPNFDAESVLDIANLIFPGKLSGEWMHKNIPQRGPNIM
jgi:hypothetical protein